MGQIGWMMVLFLFIPENLEHRVPEELAVLAVDWAVCDVADLQVVPVLKGAHFRWHRISGTPFYQLDEIGTLFGRHIRFNLMLSHFPNHEFSIIIGLVFTPSQEKDEGVALVLLVAAYFGLPGDVRAGAEQLAIDALHQQQRLLAVTEIVKLVDEARGRLWLTGIVTHQQKSDLDARLG